MFIGYKNKGSYEVIIAIHIYPLHSENLEMQRRSNSCGSFTSFLIAYILLPKLA